jgi:hypothetical protein
VRYVPLAISCILIAVTIVLWGFMFYMGATLLSHIAMLMALCFFGISVKAAIDLARGW